MARRSSLEMLARLGWRISLRAYQNLVPPFMYFFGDGVQRYRRANLHHHLLPAEEGVADEFARAQRDRLLTVRHLDGCREVIEPKVCLRCVYRDSCRSGGGRSMEVAVDGN